MIVFATFDVPRHQSHPSSLWPKSIGSLSSTSCELFIESSPSWRSRQFSISMRFHCLRRFFVASSSSWKIFTCQKSSHTESSHRVIPSIHRQIQASNLDSCSRTSTVSLGSSSFLSSFHHAKSYFFVVPRFSTFEFTHFTSLGLHPSHLVKLTSSCTCSTGHLVCALRPSVVGKYRHRCLCFGHSRFVLDHRLSKYCRMFAKSSCLVYAFGSATRRAEVMVE